MLCTYLLSLSQRMGFILFSVNIINDISISIDIKGQGSQLYFDYPPLSSLTKFCNGNIFFFNLTCNFEIFLKIDDLIWLKHILYIPNPTKCFKLLRNPSHPAWSLCCCCCCCSCSCSAKSLQSCPTLCDPIDGRPPGSPVPGILQARALEWVAISFSNAWKWKVKVKLLSRVQLFATPWTAAYQAPPSMAFSRQEYWRGVPSPSLDPFATSTYNN